MQRSNDAKNKRILIVGDIMLDSYHFGKVDRISPEAPVPVFLETGRTEYVAGGAANVAVNISAIDVDTYLCSVVGEDNSGRKLMELLNDRGVNTEFVQSDSSRPTTTKLRYIGPNNQQIMRADDEVTDEISAESEEEFIKSLDAHLKEFSLILFSDYKKGFLSRSLMRRLIKLANDYGIPTLVDVKEKDFEKYKGATLLKPNRKELSVLTNMSCDTKDQAVRAAVWLCSKAGSEYVLATLGADGMILVDRNGLVEDVKSTTHEVYDVTGAGDTSIAYLAAEMVKGTDIKRAVKVANYAAGVQVSKVGTSIVYPDEVEHAMREQENSSAGKILDFYGQGGLAVIDRIHGKGKRIVFTNGCFDILHIGHITYLRKARQFGDVLIVGINSDASVKRLKGDDRPVNNLSDRAEMLAAMDFVDYVIPFEEDTPKKLIDQVRPDVLVKGGDYSPDNIVGADTVIQHGGKVEVIPFVDGHSTSAIIKKIQKG